MVTKSQKATEKDDYRPLSHFVSALELACDHKKTGRFYIVTSDNHTAGLDIEQGEICSAKYRIKRGSEALKLLYACHWLRFRFEEGHKTHQDNPPLLNTAILLHQFENALEEHGVLPDVGEGKTTQF